MLSNSSHNMSVILHDYMHHLYANSLTGWMKWAEKIERNLQYVAAEFHGSQHCNLSRELVAKPCFTSNAWVGAIPAKGYTLHISLVEWTSVDNAIKLPGQVNTSCHESCSSLELMKHLAQGNHNLTLFVLAEI